MKTIIFVKDRSVAVYLKKILSGSGDNDSKEYKDLDESEQLAESHFHAATRGNGKMQYQEWLGKPEAHRDDNLWPARS